MNATKIIVIQYLMVEDHTHERGINQGVSDPLDLQGVMRRR